MLNDILNNLTKKEVLASENNKCKNKTDWILYM